MCVCVCVSPVPLRHSTIKPSISSAMPASCALGPSPSCGCVRCPGLSPRRAAPTARAGRGEQSPPGNPGPAECVFKAVKSVVSHRVQVAINQAVIRSCSTKPNPSVALIYQLWTGKKGNPLPLRTQASSLGALCSAVAPKAQDSQGENGLSGSRWHDDNWHLPQEWDRGRSLGQRGLVLVSLGDRLTRKAYGKQNSSSKKLCISMEM